MKEAVITVVMAMKHSAAQFLLCFRHSTCRKNVGTGRNLQWCVDSLVSIPIVGEVTVVPSLCSV